MIKKIVSQLRKILISRVEIQAVKGYYDIQETNSDLVHEIKEKIADYQLKTEPSVIENIIFSGILLLSSRATSRFTRVW